MQANEPRYSQPKNPVNMRGVLIVLAATGVGLGLPGLLYSASHEERFSYDETIINEDVTKDYSFGDASVIDAVLTFGQAADGRFVVRNGPREFAIRSTGGLTYRQGVVYFADPHISVLQEAKVDDDLGDRTAAWAPDDWAWAQAALRAAVSPVTATLEKNAKSAPMQAVRNFPILHISGEHARMIERGSLEGVYPQRGGIEFVVTYWRWTAVTFIALVAFVIGGALGAVLWLLDDFGRAAA